MVHNLSYSSSYMKKFSILMLLLALFIGVQAQKLSLDLYGGITNYQGDLQDKQFTFTHSHLAAGAGLSYAITDHLSVRSAFSLGKISADDKITKNRVRNLNFTSNLWEAQLTFQYFLFSLDKIRFSPYVAGGVAIFHFDPYTHDAEGVKHYLQPLSTEGQGFLPDKKPYKLTQLSLPIGAGIKYAITDHIAFGVELVFRKAFTDYLDDVSTNYVDENLLLLNRGEKAVELAYRGGEIKPNPPYPKAGTMRGNPKEDWYYFTAATLSFKLGTGDGKGLFGGNGLFGGGRSSGYGYGKHSIRNSTQCPPKFR